jgi:hypothetical protein
MLGKHLGLGGRQQAVEAPQNRQRQNDLAVLVALVRPAKQVADAPDEVGELRVGVDRHFEPSVSVAHFGMVGTPSSG